MKIPHLLILLLAVLLSSAANAETFSPKVVLGWQSTYGGDLTMDPTGECARDGHWQVTDHDAATDQYTCTSKNGFGSYYWNKVTGCPTNYVETANTDPAKACVYVDTEPPGNCASKAGQHTQLEQQCGLAHCPTGGVWSWSDTSHVYMGCSNGDAVVSDLSAPPSTSIGGCAVTLKSVDRSHQYGDESFIGSSNAMSATCDYDYEFTGADAPSNDTNPSPGGSSGGDKPKVGGNNGGNNGGDNPGDGGGDNGGDNPGDGGGDGGNDPCVPTPEKPCPGTGNGGGNGDNPGDGNGTPSSGDVHAIKAPTITEVKSWWESKYPNGIKGEWEDKKDQIQQTALGTFLQNWGIPESGSCPSWSFNLDRLGTHELEPPCYIWPLIRAIFYFCTALLVRRLIFGG